MFLNNFSVRVVGGNEQNGGYVEMTHGHQYSLHLRNNRSRPCDAHVEIDGKHVGTWRISPLSSITLERPVRDQSRFTFYEVGTIEATQAQLQAGSPNLGLIKVTFTPGLVPVVKPLTGPWKPYYFYDMTAGNSNDVVRDTQDLTYQTTNTPLPNDASGGGQVNCCYSAGHAAGGTGLSGHSSQTFISVSELEYDLSQQTVIHLRLVGKRQEETVRPLTTYSTPVPPPVQ